ncbi:hypothetical protein [Roseixanthobacter liquoris]|uniref:hypothetical protein n=1 Tax=Roseixanthobacter liquoris TaxID=3119921 RepID=UPI00372A609A
MTGMREGASGTDWAAAAPGYAPAPAASAFAGQSLALAAMAMVAAALLAGAGLLWVVHGPAVFLDMLTNGFGTCL